MIEDSSLLELSDTKNRRHVLARRVCEIPLYRTVLCWVWPSPFIVIPNAQMLFFVSYYSDTSANEENSFRNHIR